MGMLGGWILGSMKLDRLLTPWVCEIQAQSEAESTKWAAEKLSFVKRLPAIIRDSAGIVRGVFIYIGECLYTY